MDSAEAVLTEKFIVIQCYLKEKKINNLILHQTTRKKNKQKPKVSRRKEIIKIRAEINEI